MCCSADSAVVIGCRIIILLDRCCVFSPVDLFDNRDNINCIGGIVGVIVGGIEVVYRFSVTSIVSGCAYIHQFDAVKNLGDLLVRLFPWIKHIRCKSIRLRITNYDTSTLHVFQLINDILTNLTAGQMCIRRTVNPVFDYLVYHFFHRLHISVIPLQQ